MPSATSLNLYKLCIYKLYAPKRKIGQYANNANIKVGSYNYILPAIYNSQTNMCEMGSSMNGYCSKCIVGASLYSGIAYSSTAPCMGLHSNDVNTLYAVGASTGSFFTLTMQSDRNVVEKKWTTPKWSSQTGGVSSSTYWRLDVANDGNLIIYNDNGAQQWACGSGGHPTDNHCAVLQTDSNFVIYDSNCNNIKANGV